MRNPGPGAGVLAVGRLDLSLERGDSVVLGVASENRPTFVVPLVGMLLVLVGVLLVGRRFKRAKGTDDLVPAESDDGLGLWRKLNGLRLTSGLLPPGAGFGFTFSSVGWRLKAGGVVASTLGKTEEGEILLVLPGKIDECEPPNLTLPEGLCKVLTPNRNPGVLCLRLLAPNFPGRAERPGTPVLVDWNLKRPGDEIGVERMVGDPIKPKRNGRFVDVGSSVSEPLAGVAVTVGMAPSLVIVAGRCFTDVVRLVKGTISGRRLLGNLRGNSLRLVEGGVCLIFGLGEVAESSSGCSVGVTSSSGKASVTVSTGVTSVATSFREESNVGVAKMGGVPVATSALLSIVGRGNNPSVAVAGMNSSVMEGRKKNGRVAEDSLVGEGKKEIGFTAEDGGTVTVFFD